MRVRGGDGAGRPHWLITRYAGGRMEVFAVGLRGGGQALAVFSFQEEAKMFLNLWVAASAGAWNARQTSVGELVSILYGPCSHARKVVLDPLPGVGGGEELADVPGMRREAFLRFLLGEEEPSQLHLVSSRGRKSRRRVKHGYVA